MAEGSGAVWTMQVSGNHDDGRPFITAMFTYAGGVGARATKPGLSACSYPTGVAAVPVEVVEASAPIRFLRKELRPGSGGDGAAGRRARPDHRVHGRHRAGRGSSTRSPRGLADAPAGHLRWRQPARPARSRSTASPCAPRRASRCSRATSSGSICPAAAATAPLGPRARSWQGSTDMGDVGRAHDVRALAPARSSAPQMRRSSCSRGRTARSRVDLRRVRRRCWPHGRAL